MSARKNTLKALDRLMRHLETLVETAEMARTGDADALDYIREEMTATYSLLRGLALEVSAAEVTDDAEEIERQRWAEDARRACQGERA